MAQAGESSQMLAIDRVDLEFQALAVYDLASESKKKRFESDVHCPFDAPRAW